jgi:hypothetical protein
MTTPRSSLQFSQVRILPAGSRSDAPTPRRSNRNEATERGQPLEKTRAWRMLPANVDMTQRTGEIYDVKWTVTDYLVRDLAPVGRGRIARGGYHAHGRQFANP